MYLYYQQLIKSIIAINVFLYLFLTAGNPIIKILDTPLTEAMKDHRKVTLMRERTQVWIERSHTCLVSFCEELTIIHEESRQYKEAISHYGVSVLWENSYFDESLAKIGVVVIVKWMNVIVQSVWDFSFMMLIQCLYMHVDYGEM